MHSFLKARTESLSQVFFSTILLFTLVPIRRELLSDLNVSYLRSKKPVSLILILFYIKTLSPNMTESLIMVIRGAIYRFFKKISNSHTY